MQNVYDELLNVYFKQNDAVIVGVSGGPDSMCLLHILQRVSKVLNLKIVVAHINHNSGRPGQILDLEFVKKYCKDNKLIFELYTIDDYNNNNFEMEARNKRYKFYNSLAIKYNSKYILTAHHADDLIETILMRISRGSTLKGYSGFEHETKYENYTILRPLITVTKDEIYEYLDNYNLEYRIDESNYTDEHTRNRYRKYIVPELKKEVKNLHTKFYKFSKTLIEANEYIDSMAKKIYNDVSPSNIINIDKFNLQDNVIKLRIIYLLLCNIYKDDILYINDKHVEEILNLISSSKPNIYIYLPKGIKAVKEYNSFYLEQINTNENYLYELNELLILPDNKKIEKINFYEKDGNDVCRLNSKDITLPLYVRNKKNGDKIYVKNMDGSKKVKDVFIDSKIPKNKRDIYPVVVDSNNNIIWIPGLKKSKFCLEKNEICDIILKYY